MSANLGSVGEFPHDLNEIGDSEQTNEQSNQFPYYPDLWVGQPLGTILQEYRRSYGLNLHQVSDALKIRSVYLDYIEKGENELLPGYVYGQGFVRSYASYLGLPPEEMLALYKCESFGGHKNETFDSVSAALSAERSTPPLGILLGLIVGIGVLLYLGFFLYSRLSFGGGDGDTENQISIYQRISTFVFGSDDVSAPKPAVNADDANVLSGAGPIIVGVDGTISIAPAPKPQSSEANRPTTAQPTATPEQNTAIAAPESYFPDRKSPRPKTKPDFSAQSIQTAQVPVPRNNSTGLISNIDPSVPLISPQAVTSSTPAFGQGVGFNSPAVTVTGLPNVVNTAPIIGPRVPVNRGPIIIDNQVSLGTPQETEAPSSDTTAPPTEVNSQEPLTGNTPADTSSFLADAPVANIVNTEDVNGESRTIITAVARTWIKVVGADGSTLAERLIAKDDSFAVPAQEGLTLLTGSLGSLSFNVDGRAVKTPESISQRTDTIKLDADALLKQR